MVVRLSVAWLVALGLGVSFGGCGGTKKSSPQGEPSCVPPECPSEGEGGAAGGPSMACQPGELACLGSDIMACAADGASWLVAEACGAGFVCDEASLACAPASCEPGQLGCLGTTPTICNESGSGFEPNGADCIESGEGCEAGECVELECWPGGRLCQGTSIHFCSDGGLVQGVAEVCNAGTHCVDVPGTSAMPANAYCQPDACPSGQMACDGNVIKLCNDDGTFPADGEPCDDEFCSGGACKPQICEPLQKLCVDGAVHDCPFPGVATVELLACTDARCIELAGGASCTPSPCQPGLSACLGNAVGTCAEDGASLSQVSQDCATTDQVCNVTPSCVASAVDTLALGDQVESFGNEVLGLIIDVHSDRLLTKLEANLVFEAPRDVRWVVYELTAAGSYDLVASEITANVSGSGFASSNELSWQLEAGKRYVLGFGLVVFDGYAYYEENPGPGSCSFGAIVGGTRNSYGETMFYDANGSRYRIRTTTEPIP